MVQLISHKKSTKQEAIQRLLVVIFALFVISSIVFYKLPEASMDSNRVLYSFLAIFGLVLIAALIQIAKLFSEKHHFELIVTDREIVYKPPSSDYGESFKLNLSDISEIKIDGYEHPYDYSVVTNDGKVYEFTTFFSCPVDELFDLLKIHCKHANITESKAYSFDRKYT